MRPELLIGPVLTLAIGLLQHFLKFQPSSGHKTGTKMVRWTLVVLLVLAATLTVYMGVRADADKKSAEARESKLLGMVSKSSEKTDSLYKWSRQSGPTSPYSGALRGETKALSSADSSGFVFRVGLQYRAGGFRTESEQALRRAESLDPGNSEAKAALGLTLAENANKLVDSGRKTEARAKWLEAIDLYDAAMKQPRNLSPDRADLVRHWRDLADGRYRELYGSPPDR